VRGAVMFENSKIKGGETILARFTPHA
jgi:hypothetical protein